MSSFLLSIIFVRITYEKQFDLFHNMSIIIIVKGMRLQVDSPMLAKGSNPVMDASKIPLDKIKKFKKGIDRLRKIWYNIITVKINPNQ